MLPKHVPPAKQYTWKRGYREIDGKIVEVKEATKEEIETGLLKWVATITDSGRPWIPQIGVAK